MGVNAGARRWGRRGERFSLARVHLGRSDRVPEVGVAATGAAREERELEERERVHRLDTPRQKRYRISRKGPIKSCQVAFRLTFRVTASCTRRTPRPAKCATPDTVRRGCDDLGSRREDFRFFSSSSSSSSSSEWFLELETGVDGRWGGGGGCLLINFSSVFNSLGR